MRWPPRSSARDDREVRLRREAAIRDQVEHYSHELSATTATLGELTKNMAGASEEMIVQERRAREDTDFARTASLQAAADVASVATASEQLLEAIGEISRQAVEFDDRGAAGRDGDQWLERGNAAPLGRRQSRRRCGEPHLAHRRADQSAGAQRHDRGGARR